MPAARRTDDEDDDTTRALPIAQRIDTPLTAQTQPQADDPDEWFDRLQTEVEGDAASNVKIKVYLWKDGVRQNCRTFTAAEILERGVECIRDEFGPGKYELHRYGNKGIANRSTIFMAPPLKPTQSLQVQALPQNNDLASVLATIMQSQNALLDAIRAGQQNQHQPSRAEMLAEMAALKNLFAAQNPSNVDPMAMFAQMMGLVREMKSTATELVGDNKEPKEESLLSLVKPITEVASAVLMKQNQPQQIQPVIIPRSVASVHQQNPAQNIPQVTQEEVGEKVVEQEMSDDEESRLIIEANILQLCRMARSGAPAEEGGEFIADNLPDELIDLMKHEQWWEFVSQAFPRLKPHEEWIKAAKAHADKLLEEDASTPEDAG